MEMKDIRDIQQIKNDWMLLPNAFQTNQKSTKFTNYFKKSPKIGMFLVLCRVSKGELRLQHTEPGDWGFTSHQFKKVRSLASSHEYP